VRPCDEASGKVVVTNTTVKYDKGEGSKAGGAKGKGAAKKKAAPRSKKGKEVEEELPSDSEDEE